MFDLTPIQLLVLASGIFITGISKSGFAGGMGAITVPLLSVVMEPALAISLMLPTLMLMDIMSLRVWWGQHSKALLKILVPAGVLGVLVGYLLFHLIDSHQVIALLGGITILLGIYGLVPKNQRYVLPSSAGFTLGTLSGFTSFIGHAGGPPLNAFLLSKNLTKEAYLATAVVFFAFINLAKVPPYIGLGQFTFENVMIAALFIPMSLLGIQAGFRLQKMLNQVLFFRLINVLMIGLGIYLLAKV